MIPVCEHDGLPITRHTRSARRSPTGWSHARWGGWEGIRCPGALTGATPAEDYPAGTEYAMTMTEIADWHEARARETCGEKR
jgi:hypothetical protein